MKTVIGDFHVHTLLSPCAEIEMTPHHIVMQAAEYGIQLLAVTDHNASANAVAAIQAGERYGIKAVSYTHLTVCSRTVYQNLYRLDGKHS